MEKYKSFQTNCRFTDDEHFPYGFARSGEFTIEQANLLEAHGHAYTELAKGVRKPVNQLEIDFVIFCRGDKYADSVHERVWKRYQLSISVYSHRYSLAGLESRGTSHGTSHGASGASSNADY